MSTTTTAAKSPSPSSSSPTTPPKVSIKRRFKRERRTARSAPKLAFKFYKGNEKAPKGIYVTAWDNRFLPVDKYWNGPHNSVYSARKAMGGVMKS